MDELAVALQGKRNLIGFFPIKDEPDYRKAPLPPHLLRALHYIPPVHKMMTIDWANKFSSLESPCIFVPGKLFDRAGVRIDRKNDWYDRFLATIPAGWLRVGIVSPKGFSEAPLNPPAKDERMDWLLMFDGVNWSAFRTNARGK